MARLPDSTAFGPIDAGPSGRTIASYDTAGFARGAAAQAAGVEKLGEGIEKGAKGVGIYAKHQQHEDDTLTEARADSFYLLSTKQARDELSREADPEKLEERYTPRFRKILEDSASLIPNEKKRELFVLRRTPDAETHILSAKGRQLDLVRDRSIAGDLQQFERLEKSYLTEQDPERRNDFIRSGNGIIDGWESRGWITAVDAQARRKDWAQGIATKVVDKLAPQEKLSVLGGFDGDLERRESSGNPKLVNQFGYAGLYQFGAPRLETLGVYKPGAGEDLNTWSKTGKEASGKWTGEFSVPGFPAVRTLKDFLETPSAQRAVYSMHRGGMDKEIQANGLDAYIGKTVGGKEVTRDSLHAMMHLGGVGGAKRYLKSDGADDPSDANGTRLSDYAKLGNRAAQEQVVALIPEAKRQQMYERAGRDVERVSSEERANVSALMSDDLSSIERTGTGLADDKLSRNRVAGAIGEAGAVDWEAARARSRRVHGALDGIELLPEGDVERRLQKVEPVPGAVGYAEDMAAYERARKRADKFLEARRADPALAAEVFPAVKEARQAAVYSGPPEQRQIDPESAQAIIRSRLAAQSQIGIAEPMAVTRSEARQIARGLRMIGEDDGESVEKFIKTLRSTYGDYADEVLTATLQHANVNKELSNLAVETLNSLAAGNKPPAEKVQRLETQTNVQSMDQAMTGAGYNTSFDSIMSLQGFPIGEVAPAIVAPPGKLGPVDVAKGTLEPKDVKLLDQRRDLQADFDLKYGGGMAKRVLDEIDRRRKATNPGDRPAAGASK